MSRYQSSAPTSTALLSRRHVLQGSAVLAFGAAGLSSSGARAAGGLVALVHTQAAGDNGPVDSMIAALKRLSSEKGFTMRAIYAQDAATYESIFRSLGDAGAAIVVSTFNEVADPIKAVAPSYPKTKFIQLFADPFQPAIPNVETVGYDYYLGCYLSGLFASRISKSGKIGYVGGMSLPALNADLNGLKAGAAAANPAIAVTGAFAGSFQDPAKGQEIASQMYQSGVDYIQTDSAATDTGIIQAANEGSGRMVSAIAKTQYKLGPKTVAAIVKLDFGLSLYQEVSKALEAGWIGHHLPTGIDTGVVDFELSDVFLKEGPADLVAKAKTIWPEIETAKKAIITGTVKVPLNTTL